MKIVKCRCGRCDKYEFEFLCEGKFSKDEAPELLKALKKFVKKEKTHDRRTKD